MAADVKRTAQRTIRIRTDSNLDVWREDRAVYLKVPCGVLYAHTFELSLDEARELARALEEAAQW